MPWCDLDIKCTYIVRVDYYFAGGSEPFDRLWMPESEYARILEATGYPVHRFDYTEYELWHDEDETKEAHVYKWDWAELLTIQKEASNGTDD